jgi:hypothetical protein
VESNKKGTLSWRGGHKYLYRDHVLQDGGLDTWLTTLVCKKIAARKPKEVKSRSNLAESLSKSMAQKVLFCQSDDDDDDIHHFHFHILPSPTQILPICPLHSAACYKICSVSQPCNARNLANT